MRDRSIPILQTVTACRKLTSFLEAWVAFCDDVGNLVVFTVSFLQRKYPYRQGTLFGASC